MSRKYEDQPPTIRNTGQHILGLNPMNPFYAQSPPPRERGSPVRGNGEMERIYSPRPEVDRNTYQMQRYNESPSQSPFDRMYNVDLPKITNNLDFVNQKTVNLEQKVEQMVHSVQNSLERQQQFEVSLDVINQNIKQLATFMNNNDSMIMERMENLNQTTSRTFAQVFSAINPMPNTISKITSDIQSTIQQLRNEIDVMKSDMENTKTDIIKFQDETASTLNIIDKNFVSGLKSVEEAIQDRYYDHESNTNGIMMKSQHISQNQSVLQERVDNIEKRLNEYVLAVGKRQDEIFTMMSTTSTFTPMQSAKLDSTVNSENFELSRLDSIEASISEIQNKLELLEKSGTKEEVRISTITDSELVGRIESIEKEKNKIVENLRVLSANQPPDTPDPFKRRYEAFESEVKQRLTDIEENRYDDSDLRDKIDEIDERLHFESAHRERIERLETSFNSRTVKVNAFMDDANARLSAAENGFTAINQRIDDSNVKIDSLQKRCERIERAPTISTQNSEKADNHSENNARIESINDHIAALEERIKKVDEIENKLNELDVGPLLDRLEAIEISQPAFRVPISDTNLEEKFNKLESSVEDLKRHTNIEKPHVKFRWDYGGGQRIIKVERRLAVVSDAVMRMLHERFDMNNVLERLDRLEDDTLDRIARLEEESITNAEHDHMFERLVNRRLLVLEGNPEEEEETTAKEEKDEKQLDFTRAMRFDPAELAKVEREAASLDDEPISRPRGVKVPNSPTDGANPRNRPRSRESPR